MTFDHMNKLEFLCYIHKPSLVPIGLQLFNWGQFCIFSLFYNLTSYDLLTLVCDLWPHQQMRVPMLHLWLKFGWKPSKYVGPGCGQMLTLFHNRQQQRTKWYLCVFPAKTGDTKTPSRLWSRTTCWPTPILRMVQSNCNENWTQRITNNDCVNIQQTCDVW